MTYFDFFQLCTYCIQVCVLVCSKVLGQNAFIFIQFFFVHSEVLLFITTFTHMFLRLPSDFALLATYILTFPWYHICFSLYPFALPKLFFNILAFICAIFFPHHMLIVTLNLQQQGENSKQSVQLVLSPLVLERVICLR